MTLRVEFLDSVRLPARPPDPACPRGVDVDSSEGRLPACWVRLPKFSHTGLFVVACDTCGQRAAITRPTAASMRTTQLRAYLWARSASIPGIW